MLAVKENKTPLIDRFIELGSDVCARNNVSRHFPNNFYDDIYYTFSYDVVKLYFNHSWEKKHKTIESLIANTLRELNHKVYYDDDPKIHTPPLTTQENVI